MMPVLGALILQAAYGAVDLLVVGRFGSTSGLSAVSTGSQVLNLVTFVVIQFAMGITVLIARYLGEKRPERIGAVIGGGAVVFTMMSVALFIAMVGFARPISVLMQAPAEAVDLTASYVRICGAGIFFIVAYNLLSAIFRGLGDSKSPLLFVLVACIVNIIGDRSCNRNSYRTGAQRSICGNAFAEKRSSVCDHKEGFSPEPTVPEIPEDRSSACTAGISDTDFFPGTLCICQQTWTGSFVRLRSCM